MIVLHSMRIENHGRKVTLVFKKPAFQWKRILGCGSPVGTYRKVTKQLQLFTSVHTTSRFLLSFQRQLLKCTNTIYV